MIDLEDYSRTAAQRGWGAGWPSCAGARGDLATVVTGTPEGRITAKVVVRKRIARLVNLLLRECSRQGYALRAEQCGGYNCRSIGGTRTASNHSWGLAVDLNWQINPMRRPLTTNVPGWMVKLWNRYGFAWGGHYRGTPDPMHFEFMGTPADADEMTGKAVRELLHEEDDMTPEENWKWSTENFHGEKVEIRHVVVGAEARAVDLQKDLAQVGGKVDIMHDRLTAIEHNLESIVTYLKAKSDKS